MPIFPQCNNILPFDRAGEPRVNRIMLLNASKVSAALKETMTTRVEVCEQRSTADRSMALVHCVRPLSRHRKVIAAGQEQRPPGRRPCAIGRQKPGTLRRKHGHTPAEPSAAESGKAKRHHG